MNFDNWYFWLIPKYYCDIIHRGTHHRMCLFSYLPYSEYRFVFLFVALKSDPNAQTILRIPHSPARIFILDKFWIDNVLERCSFQRMSCKFQRSNRWNIKIQLRYYRQSSNCFDDILKNRGNKHCCVYSGVTVIFVFEFRFLSRPWFLQPHDVYDIHFQNRILFTIFYGKNRKRQFQDV